MPRRRIQDHVVLSVKLQLSQMALIRVYPRYQRLNLLAAAMPRWALSKKLDLSRVDTERIGLPGAVR